MHLLVAPLEEQLGVPVTSPLDRQVVTSQEQLGLLEVQELFAQALESE